MEQQVVHSHSHSRPGSSASSASSTSSESSRLSSSWDVVDNAEALDLAPLSAAAPADPAAPAAADSPSPLSQLSHSGRASPAASSDGQPVNWTQQPPSSARRTPALPAAVADKNHSFDYGSLVAPAVEVARQEKLERLAGSFDAMVAQLSTAPPSATRAAAVFSAGHVDKQAEGVAPEKALKHYRREFRRELKLMARQLASDSESEKGSSEAEDDSNEAHGSATCTAVTMFSAAGVCNTSLSAEDLATDEAAGNGNTSAAGSPPVTYAELHGRRHSVLGKLKENILWFINKIGELLRYPFVKIMEMLRALRQLITGSKSSNSTDINNGDVNKPTTMV